MTVFLVLLINDFDDSNLNGQHGSASVVSTMISSRSIGPRKAMWIAAAGMALGPFLLGTAVTSTLGQEFVSPGEINVQVVISALLATILWSGFALWSRIPVSISQALFGGVAGAAWVGFGMAVIQMGGLVKVLIGLFLSPLLGLAFGYILVQVCYRLATIASPHVNLWFQRGQVAAAFAMAIAFGSNDGQKMAGILSLGLATGGLSHAIDSVYWLLGFSAMAIALGTLVGGWRLIHTMGGKFYKIRPIHGFGAQVASTGVLFGSGLFGWPVSGSQVMTSSIVGAGSADRLQKVRWGVVQQIFIGWALTIPASGLLSAVIYLVIRGAGR